MFSAFGLQELFLASLMTIRGNTASSPSMFPKTMVLDGTNAYAEVISKADMESLIQSAYDHYTPVSRQFGDAQFRIVMDWRNNGVNAWSDRNGRSGEVQVLGGFLRHSNSNLPVMAMVLCHEIAHLYAGKPYSTQLPEHPQKRLCAEGQADYWAAKECFPKLGARLPLANPNPLPAIVRLCGNRPDADVCQKALAASVDLMAMLDELGLTEMGPTATSLDAWDPHVARQTLTSDYPKSQCRLDTFRNAVLGLERPACWFAGETQSEVPAAPGTSYFSPEEIHLNPIFQVRESRQLNCRTEPSLSATVAQTFGSFDTFEVSRPSPSQDGKVWMFLAEHSCWVAANRELVQPYQR